MIVIYIAPLVAVVGLLLYALATNPKVARVGEIMFFAGLLATLLIVGRAAALHV